MKGTGKFYNTIYTIIAGCIILPLFFTGITGCEDMFPGGPEESEGPTPAPTATPFPDEPVVLEDFEGQLHPGWGFWVNTSYDLGDNQNLALYTTGGNTYLMMLEDALGPIESWGNGYTGYTAAILQATVELPGEISFDIKHHGWDGLEPDNPDGSIEFWIHLDSDDLGSPPDPPDWSNTSEIYESWTTFTVTVPLQGTYKFAWKASKPIVDVDEDRVFLDNIIFTYDEQ